MPRVCEVSEQLLGRHASLASSDHPQHRPATWSLPFLSLSSLGKDPTNNSETGLTTLQTLLDATQRIAEFLHHLHPLPAGEDTYSAARMAKPGLLPPSPAAGRDTVASRGEPGDGHGCRAAGLTRSVPVPGKVSVPPSALPAGCRISWQGAVFLASEVSNSTQSILPSIEQITLEP